MEDIGKYVWVEDDTYSWKAALGIMDVHHLSHVTRACKLLATIIQQKKNI